MAGEIRQPIDLAALEKYIEKNVPEIRTPLEVKQVNIHSSFDQKGRSIDLLLSYIVWLRTIKSNIPARLTKWPEIRHEEEASWGAPLQDSPPGRARIPHTPCAGEDRSTCAKGVLPMRGCQSARDTFLYHGVHGWEDSDGCMVSGC